MNSLPTQKEMTEIEILSSETRTNASHDEMPITYNKERLKILLILAVTASCFVAIFLFFLGIYDTKNYVRDSLDEHLWRNFSTHVRHTVKTFDAKYPHNVLLVLFIVHALQVLFCLPLLHVTKIMYGYFFDAWHGFLACCCWEMTLVALFVLMATQNPPSRPPAREFTRFFSFVDQLRDRGLLTPFMIGLHISSVPLVTSTCLVLFQVVSRCEFLLTHAISTLLTSCKDAWLGQFLATSDGDAQNILIFSVLISLSALLPAALGVLLMGFAANTAGTKKKTPG